MNWKTKVVSTALALSVMVPSVALAADETSTVSKLLTKGFGQHRLMDESQRQAMKDQMKEQLLELVNKYEPESAEEWNDALAEHEQLAAQLKEKFQPSDEIKEKIKDIRTKVKDGTLTQEQAREELSKLGLGDKAMKFMDKLQLSDEDKAKLQDIRTQVENGTLTPEQAKEELSKLGLGDKAMKFMDRPQLSDEDKAKLQDIRTQVENGTLTREQAREELSKLGIEGKGIRLGDRTNLFAQLTDAKNANDESKIKELLPQLLEQMQERNQKMADKISETN